MVVAAHAGLAGSPARPAPASAASPCMMPRRDRLERCESSSRLLDVIHWLLIHSSHVLRWLVMADRLHAPDDRSGANACLGSMTTLAFGPCSGQAARLRK